MALNTVEPRSFWALKVGREYDAAEGGGECRLPVKRWPDARTHHSTPASAAEHRGSTGANDKAGCHDRYIIHA